LPFALDFPCGKKRAETHNLSDLFQHIVGVILNKAWLTIGILVLIGGIIFAYLAYFANFLDFVSFIYANTSPWGNTWLFALLLPIIVIAVGAAIIY
jgi:hypothetical protein